MDPSGYYLYTEAIRMIQIDKEQTKSMMLYMRVLSKVSMMCPWWCGFSYKYNKSMKLLNKCIPLFNLGVKIKAINGLNNVYSCIHEQNKITKHWIIYHKIQIYTTLTSHSWNNLKHLLIKGFPQKN